MPAPGALESLVWRLRDHGVRDLFFHVGPLDARGDIPAWDAETWRVTRDRIRALLPSARLFAWVGGVTDFALAPAADVVDLASVDTRKAIAATCASLITKGGFDGIHYDLELIATGDRDWLDLLERTRPVAPLSVATPNLRPPFPWPAGGWLDHRVLTASLWTLDYFRELATRCDQIAVMAYDTAMPTPPLYARFVAWETAALARGLQSSDCRLLIGVPSYDDGGPTHFRGAETLATALLGVRAGLARAGPSRNFDGVALYAEWTTDATEWRDLRLGWP